MKKIILYVLTFIIVFVVAVTLLFPYSAVATLALDKVVERYNIPVSYDRVESGLVTTKIAGITYQGNYMGDVTLNYSPLSLITKKITGRLDSPYGVVDALLKGNSLTADAGLDLWRLGNLFEQAITGNGTVTVNYNIETFKGDVKISTGEVTIDSPMGEVTVESLSADATLDSNTIHVTKMATTGFYAINLSGATVLDMNNIYRSPLNFTGDMTIMGMSSRFNLKGTLAAPQYQPI